MAKHWRLHDAVKLCILCYVCGLDAIHFVYDKLLREQQFVLGIQFSPLILLKPEIHFSSVEAGYKLHRKELAFIFWEYFVILYKIFPNILLKLSLIHI